MFFQTASDEIGFPGDVIGRDFNFVANGLVDIEIVELSLSGPPVAGANVNLFSFEDEDLGGGFFSPPDFEFGTTDPSGRIDGVQLPLGGFTAEIEGREILEVYQDGVQIELTELSLQSVEPITVTFVASEPSIPGDIEEVQFSSVTENEGDLIQIDIFYTQPLAGAIIGGADFIIEIDADQNANTGSTSEIAFLSGGQTNLGVDFILFGSLFGYEGGFVDVFERNSFDFLGSGVIFFGTDEEDEMDFSHVIIQVPQVLSGPEDELFDLFGGDTQANIALLSTVNLDFGGEFEIFEAGGSDVVPGDENGANVFMNVDLAGILGDLVFQDDTDDTFEIFDLA